MDRYNLTPFNLGTRESGAVARYQRISGIMDITGVVGAGKNIRSQVKCNIDVLGTVKILIRKLSHISGDVGIHANLSAIKKNAYMKFSADVNVLSDITVGKNIYQRSAYEAVISGVAKLGKNMHTRHGYDIEMLSDILIGKNTYSAFDAQININSHIQISSYIFDVAVISVTIPPGGEIRIDSDNRTVLLGDQNIFYAYRDVNGNPSDWIYLFRETEHIQLGSGSGGALDGTLQYDPRYL